MNNNIIKIEQDLTTISSLLAEYSNNNDSIKKLTNELRYQSRPIQEALERNNKNFLGIKYAKLTRVEIVDLIANIDIEQKKKFQRINSLISNVNNHVYLLTQMVNNLMSFYNVSYEELKQCVKTIDDIGALIDERIDDTDRISNQVGVLIKSQLERVYNEGVQKELIEKLNNDILYLKKQNKAIRLQLNKITNNTSDNDGNSDIEIPQDINDELLNIYDVDKRIYEHSQKYHKHIQILWGLMLGNIFLIAFILLSHIL